MSFYVYIIHCADDSFYTGYTADLETRITQHKTGKGSRWTKSHGFKEYTYITFEMKKVALHMERVIKGWKVSKKMDLFKAYGIYT